MTLTYVLRMASRTPLPGDTRIKLFQEYNFKLFDGYEYTLHRTKYMPI